MTILREFVDTGETSVVCVNHDPRILGLADRLLWLEDGRLSEGRRPAPEPTGATAQGFGG